VPRRWCRCSRDGSAFNTDGDPEFVNVIPTGQYLNRYLFFTDPTYPTTNLVFIRKKATDNTFKDVKGNGGQFECVRWDISSGMYMGQTAATTAPTRRRARHVRAHDLGVEHADGSRLDELCVSRGRERPIDQHGRDPPNPK